MNSYDKYTKLYLYKNGIINFLNFSKKNNTKWINIINDLEHNLNNIEYTIGALFLTEMNKYCKNNNIMIHGYYIVCALINLFIELKSKIIHNKQISSNSIVYLLNNIAVNIDYLNSRTDVLNIFRKQINENFSTLIIEITNKLNEIVIFNKTHIDIEKLSSGCCNIDCYTCWVDELLTKFFYIVLLLAKFMGTGNTKDPNLYKLAEYYANIYYTILKLDNVDNNLNISIYQNLYNSYNDYKGKLIYSIMELDIKSSETIDEIIKFLDDYIMTKFISHL